MAPFGECLRGYKARAVELLAWLNPVVIPGLRAGTCCAVLRGSLLIMCKQVRLLFV